MLLHGEDEGLIRERARTLTSAVAGRLDDPFLVVELTRDGWPRIPGEMAALSMIGGRRVVLVRDATDATLGLVTEALNGPGEALLILEAAGLGRGKLRSFAETSALIAAIACYPEEEQALHALIEGAFTDLKVRAHPEAIAWLAQTLGGDRGMVRGEIEKLALLAGPERRVTEDMVRACTGEAAAGVADDGILAASLGDMATSDRAVDVALADGLNGVALLRMATGHLQKMHQARLRMASGLSATDAVKTMRPPVFYKSVPRMAASLSLWPTDRLLRLIEEARRAELACKQTGSRPELLARRFVQTLARTAQAQKSKEG